MISQSQCVWESLTIGWEGAVATVTLSRPDLMNPFDSVLHQEFVEALQTVRMNDEIRAVVLASTGKVFSAGGDFDAIRRVHDDSQHRRDVLDQARSLIYSLLDFPLPIVVSLQGDAIGLGATIVGGCDAVVAVRSAGIADPHVVVGLVAGDGGCVVWPQAVGMLRAKRFLLTGDRLTAEEAHAIGLVTDLVDEPKDVLPMAQQLAGRIASLPPLAVQGTKRALNRISQQRAGEVQDLAQTLEALTMGSADLVEALDAIQQRREPRFQGS